MVGSIFVIPQTDTHEAPRVTNVNRQDVCALVLREFIAGPENSLVRQAAGTVTSEWGRFNPLYISGPSGVGKSHLLRCLLESATQFYPGLKHTLLSGADYARAISDAMDVDSLDELREQHRSVDLLMVDGLQEIATKTYAQQELLHTLDRLMELHGQIIVTATLPLDEMPTLLPALASRLLSGLCMPIAPPTPATCGAMIEQLARQSQMDVPQPVLEHLLRGSTRRKSRPLLFSDLTALLTELRCLEHQPASENAIDAVTRITQRSLPLAVTVKDINKAVAKYFHVTLRELTGSSRRQTVVRARAMSVLLIRTLLNLSYQAIGQHLGGRDHTTILHALARAESLIDTDPGFARAAKDLAAPFV